MATSSRLHRLRKSLTGVSEAIAALERQLPPQDDDVRAFFDPDFARALRDDPDGAILLQAELNELRARLLQFTTRLAMLDAVVQIRGGVASPPDAKAPRRRR